MAHFLSDVVPLADREAPGHRDAHLDVESVANPSRANVADTLDRSRMAGRVPDLVQDVRVDAIEHAGKNHLRRLPDEKKDRDRDQDADDGISGREAGRYAGSAHQNLQT